MSVIIRLQGLPRSAGAMDIRNFFKGISLPSGRISIFGGDTGDAFIAFSSDEDARKAMMFNMGYIGDGQIFLNFSGTAEMRRRLEEVKIHRSASDKSTDSSPEPAPAQQAVSAPQPQQQPLQQDPFLGTRFPHTIEPEGHGYIGRGPEKPVVGVQDPLLMYSQKLSGAQGYGDQIKPSDPNKYGSRITQLGEAYDNHVAGARRDEPIPHPSQDKGFGVALQSINQLVSYFGSKTFSVQDPKDRKSYPPASRLVHKINLRDPRLVRRDKNPSIYQQHRERGVSIASYQESDPQRIDQGRRPPLRPMYPGNTSDLATSRPPRREPWEGSTPPGQDHLYSGQNEIPCGRMDRGNLIHGHVQGAFVQHSKLEGPQPIRRIDERIDLHSQNRSDASALGWSYIVTQRTYKQLHAAGTNVPQFRRVDEGHVNKPDIQLPRRDRQPSFMNSLGASKRFPSHDIRPTLDQGNYFGRPVGPQPFGPVEVRGTKRPHSDESGQSPPLTGIAKRMKTTIRYRETT